MPSSTVLAPGSAAPDFTLPDQDRASWSLAEHVKKGDVVLCFFPFAFTSVCGTEMECISKEFARWQKSGATCVGVSCDSPAALKAWAEQNGYTHTLLSDLHRAVVKPYGLHWANLNVANRGTVIIGQSADGHGTVKWSQSREPGKGMDFDEVMAKLA
jgi:peroxiredoxin (alkyl hydroperoxide reductase subunit C)